MTPAQPLPTTKICSSKDCDHGGGQQPIDNFGRNDAAPDGHAYYCRKCASRTQATWKKAHPEKAKQWRKNYVERNKAKNRARRAAAADESRYVETD